MEKIKPTAKSLMAFIEQEISDGKPFSPARWIEGALCVNALAGDIDNQLAHYEAEMNAIEAEYIKTDMPASKAKVLARSQIAYEDYLRTKALLNRIGEFLSLARRRAQILEI